MAKLTTTPEERAANSYLEWDDAALGRFTKLCALKLDALKDDAEGLRKVTASSCAMMLVADAFLANATTFTLDLEGHTHAEIPTGNWRIIVKRIKAPKKS